MNSIVPVLKNAHKAYMRDKRAQRFWLVVTLIVLLLSSAYGSYLASKQLLTNADAIVNVYLASGPVGGNHHIFVQNQHTLLFKFPLFWLQSHLAYNDHSFYIANALMSVLTALGWCVLLGIALGRRYIGLIALFLSSIFLASPLFNFDLTYTTVRNIEFVIALGFILALGKYIFAKRPSRRLLISLGLIGLLYSFVLASDSYFLAVYSLALLLVFALMVNEKNKARIGKALLIMVSTVVLSVLIKALIGALGWLTITTNNDIPLTVVQWELLLPSIWQTIHQVIQLQGADIFNMTLHSPTIYLFANFILFFCSVGGFYWYIKDLRKGTTKAGLNYEAYVVVSILGTAVFTILIYILSDRVFQHDGTHIIASQGERYLTGVILANSLGFVLFWKKLHAHRISIYKKLPTYSVGLLLGISLLSATTQLGSAHTEALAKSTPSMNDYTTLAKVLHANDVRVVVGSHWYGSTVKFWSDQLFPGTHLKFAVVDSCNVAADFLTRSDWYVASPVATRSALVLNPSDCNTGEARQIYGPPTYTLPAHSSENPSSEELLIYNYDIRTKIDMTRFYQ